MVRNIISGMVYFIVIGLIVIAGLAFFTTVKTQFTEFTGAETTENKANITDNLEISETDIINYTNDTENNNDLTSEIKEESSPIDNLLIYEGDLELPVKGATGYASVKINVLRDGSTDVLKVLEPGAAFLILEESGDWWRISSGDTIGWIKHRECMINLPDVIPSIVYNNTNAYSSVFRSSQQNIPDVTGETLYTYNNGRYDGYYNGKAYNERLQKYEYIMPVLYSMSKKIYAAQQYALKNGDTLVIYEGYRPYETQMRVVGGMQELIKDNPLIKKEGMDPWNISWFIATSTSNHQQGYAMDVTLGKITKTENAVSGLYKYTKTECYEYQMPCDIHELSKQALTFTTGVTILSTEAWKKAELSDGMKTSPHAQDLQKYCTDAGLTPLASEWWHFNDLGTYYNIKNFSDGRYEIKDCFSIDPN